MSAPDTIISPEPMTLEPVLPPWAEQSGDPELVAQLGNLATDTFLVGPKGENQKLFWDLLGRSRAFSGTGRADPREVLTGLQDRMLGGDENAAASLKTLYGKIGSEISSAAESLAASPRPSWMKRLSSEYWGVDGEHREYTKAHIPRLIASSDGEGGFTVYSIPQGEDKRRQLDGLLADRPERPYDPNHILVRLLNNRSVRSLGNIVFNKWFGSDRQRFIKSTDQERAPADWPTLTEGSISFDRYDGVGVSVNLNTNRDRWQTFLRGIDAVAWDRTPSPWVQMLPSSAKNRLGGRITSDGGPDSINPGLSQAIPILTPGGFYRQTQEFGQESFALMKRWLPVLGKLGSREAMSSVPAPVVDQIVGVIKLLDQQRVQVSDRNRLSEVLSSFLTDGISKGSSDQELPVNAASIFGQRVAALALLAGAAKRKVPGISRDVLRDALTMAIPLNFILEGDPGSRVYARDYARIKKHHNDRVDQGIDAVLLHAKEARNNSKDRDDQYVYLLGNSVHLGLRYLESNSRENDPNTHQRP